MKSKIKLEPLPPDIIRTMVVSGTIYTRRRGWKYERLFWAVVLAAVGTYLIVGIR